MHLYLNSWLHVAATFPSSQAEVREQQIDAIVSGELSFAEERFAEAGMNDWHTCNVCTYWYSIDSTVHY